MFVDAIERAGGFTRAIHTIARLWGAKNIVPGSGTFFFVNCDGWALTCAHVAKQFLDAAQIAEQFNAFKAERDLIPEGKNRNHAVHLLEKKHGYGPGKPLELHSRLIGCVEGPLNIDIKFHPGLDVALLKFNGFTRLLCDTFPTFARDDDDLKQGKSLCRLGFPFPEFNNYGYDESTDSIGWTATGQELTPRFPIDGMVTRHVADEAGKIIAFELSTPGIRGQSGGPAFDIEGKVWGMQSITKHLDLDFDVDVEVMRGAGVKRIQESAFLHVGGCIHVKVLKEFMREHNVSFHEG
ncbi:MAG: serine protease [Pyrinomonadaceae bacterium]